MSEIVDNIPASSGTKKLNEKKINLKNLSGSFQITGFLTLLKKYTLQNDFYVELIEGTGIPSENTDKVPAFFKVNFENDPSFKRIQNQIEELSNTICLLKGSNIKVGADKGLVHFEDNSSTSNQIEFSITVSSEGESLRFLVIYKTDLSDPFLFEQIQVHYYAILDQAMGNENKRISQVDLLSTEERDLLIYQWNDTDKSYPEGMCLHHLFETQVDKNPNKVAAYFDGESITYEELNQRANKFSHILISKELKPDDLVAIYMDLTLDTLIAIFGVLKAGGAYLPLHTEYPVERLKYINKKANPRYIICQGKYVNDLEFTNEKTLVIEDMDLEDPNIYAENPVTRTYPGNLAYVIFTSGSTGMPKGAMIQHDNVVNNMFILKDRYQLTSSDTVLSMPTLAFDASVSKLFPILTVAGGSVVLPTLEESHNPELMLQLISNHGCPYFAATPSFIRVINAMNPDLSRLRMVTSGGETLHYRDIDKIIKKTPVLNVYGPTETTVSSCSFKITKNDNQKNQRIPIGKPNPNCKIYVLDDQMQPTPIGCTGKLFIGGKGVGRGYINSPKLTKKLFVRSPFNKNETLYDTGDFVRWLPDGNLDFCGRDDHQIKVRGYRITTDEIETHLSNHEHVNNNKVLAYTDRNQNQSIAAFVEPGTREALSEEDIRNFLSKRLPRYMIPSRIFFEDKLPLNANNKVDIQALKKKLEVNGTIEKAEDKVQNVPGSELLAYTRELIENPKLESDESIFQAGAHSIHMMQLNLHIANRYHVNIPIQYLFENHTVDQIIAKIKTLGNTAGSSTIPSISGRKREVKKKPEFLPLSPNERRVWFLHQYQVEKSVYNISKGYLIKGGINLQALQNALNTLLSRHDNFRKTFQLVEGEPKAKIQNIKVLKINQPTEDEVDFNRNEIKTSIENCLLKERERPFDLSNEIPIRVGLFRIEKEKHLLSFTFHHIIADAWSFPIISSELGQLYDANIKGKQLTLPSLKDAYESYPYFQPDINQQNKHLQYWVKELNGKVAPMNLPYDFHLEEHSDRGSVEQMTISASLFDGIQRLAHKTNSTVFTVLFSTLNSLIYLYTREENIRVAIPIAERNSTTSNLIGFFVNTVLINTSFEEDPSFAELLEGIRNKLPEIQGNANLPFDELVNELRKEQQIDADALIQIMFTYQDISETLDLEGLNVEKIDVKSRYAKFDLTVSIEQNENEKLISAEYRNDKFKATTIQRFLTSFIRLLEEAVKDDHLRPSEFNLADDETKKNILYNWNNTFTVQTGCPIHELFELQTDITPTAKAVVYDNRKYLTYEELNERANQLAHFLLEFKLRPEDPVALLMEESEQSLICMLGVLKAGGAFIPIDLTNPKDRIKQMVKEAKSQFLLTSDKLKSKLSIAGLKTIYLQKSQRKISKQSKENPKIGIKGDSMAYVMFTSGTTGIPKAVAIEHQSVSRLVMNTNYLELGRIGPFSRLIKTGSFGFDASTFEIWGMLLNGGTVYMYPRNSLLSPQFLKKNIFENHINIMWLTSSWFNELVDTDLEIFKPVKYLLVGGEKLSVEHVNKLRKANRHIFLYNMYGPTENTTFSLFYKINEVQKDNIPIGRPISNSTAYILNKSGQFLPPGIEGEIFVGGAGLARGYLNNQSETEERFIEHPFKPGEKLYRTGDLGKWREDGSIEFLGRLDDQIKFNGFRIETKEIENYLNQHDNVIKSVVLMKESAGQKKLVAFYISSNGHAIVSEELRAFLLGMLPAYMIPAEFKPIENIPLTTNGKLDADKLLSEIKFNSPTTKHVPPQNLMQQQLALLWEEILGVKAVSITSSFFELGGHSLLAVKLMSRIEKEFKRELSVSVLFEAPTIQDLARIIEANHNKDSCIVEIQKQGSNPPLFVIPGYLFYYHLASHLGDDQPVYGFEPLHGLTIKEVAERYIAEIKKIQPEGPYYIGGYCAGGIVGYEIAQQLLGEGEEIALLALFEVYTPEATASKMSFKYINEKWSSLNQKLKGSPTVMEKINVIGNESNRAWKYIQHKWGSTTSDSYILKPYPGKIQLFRASEGMVGAKCDAYAGWDKYCNEENIYVHRVQGNHNTIFKEPNVAVTAQKILKCINNISVRSKTST